jgi:hypothetical protein
VVGRQGAIDCVGGGPSRGGGRHISMLPLWRYTYRGMARNINASVPLTCLILTAK